MCKDYTGGETLELNKSGKNLQAKSVNGQVELGLNEERDIGTKAK